MTVVRAPSLEGVKSDAGAKSVQIEEGTTVNKVWDMKNEKTKEKEKNASEKWSGLKKKLCYRCSKNHHPTNLQNAFFVRNRAFENLLL